MCGDEGDGDWASSRSRTKTKSIRARWKLFFEMFLSARFGWSCYGKRLFNGLVHTRSAFTTSIGGGR
jgi:hypothetical protein